MWDGFNELYIQTMALSAEAEEMFIHLFKSIPHLYESEW